MMSHYIVYDAPTIQRGRLQEALCGFYVDPHTMHSTEPTCPTCKKLLADDDADFARVTATKPTGSEPIDNYLKREREREQFETPSHARAAKRAGVSE